MLCSSQFAMGRAFFIWALINGRLFIVHLRLPHLNSKKVSRFHKSKNRIKTRTI